MNKYRVHGFISTHPHSFYDIDIKVLEAKSFNHAYAKLAYDLEKPIGINKKQLYFILKKSKSLKVIKFHGG